MRVLELIIIACLSSLCIFNSSLACSRSSDNPKTVSNDNLDTDRQTNAAENNNDFMEEDTEMTEGEPVSDHIVRKFIEHEEKMFRKGVDQEKPHRHDRKLRNANRLEDIGTGSGIVSDDSLSVVLPGSQTEYVNPSIHVVAEGDDRTKIGYDIHGKLEGGSWEVKTMTGTIQFADGMIQLLQEGTYHIYAQMYYHDPETASAMSHCIAVGPTPGDLENKACAMSSANHHYDMTRPWMNLNTNYVAGTYTLQNGTFISIQMNMGGDLAPHPRSILFDGKNCYFGLFKIA